MSENPQPQEARPPQSGSSVWALLNLALSVAIILLCMFLLKQTQDIGARLSKVERQLSSAPAPHVVPPAP